MCMLNYLICFLVASYYHSEHSLGRPWRRSSTLHVSGGTLSKILGVYGSIRPTKMKKVKDLNMTMIDNGAPWMKVSRLTCASTCLRLNQSCFSFTYDSQKEKCTLGTSLVTAASPRPSHIELFTQATYCDKRENFSQSTRGNVSSCLWISDMTQDYISARSVCKELNSYLYTIKVIEKLYILRDELRARHPFSKTSDTWVWVGLNDIETKNVYRWEDDGAELNMQTQPNNIDDSQRCIAYSSTTYYPLIDYFCDTSLLFICERKMFT